MLEGMTHFKHEAVDRTGSLQIVHSTLLHQQPAQDAVVALKQLRKDHTAFGNLHDKSSQLRHDQPPVLGQVIRYDSSQHRSVPIKNSTQKYNFHRTKTKKFTCFFKIYG